MAGNAKITLDMLQRVNTGFLSLIQQQLKTSDCSAKTYVLAGSMNFLIANEMLKAPIHPIDEKRWNVIRDYLIRAEKLFSQTLCTSKQARCWACLGNLYLEGNYGVKGDNIEKAIHYYSKALEVFTKGFYQAMVYISLGNSYQDRIKGEKKRNFEQAFCYYGRAIQILVTLEPHEKYVTYAVMAYNGLGNLYQEANRSQPPIVGSRKDNIERAIENFEKALLVCPNKRSWATINVNLGNVFEASLEKENINQAIEYYKRALTVFERSSSCEWADTCHNLGNVYLKIAGEKKENIQFAKDYSENALSFFKKNNFPFKRACALTSLGDILHHMYCQEKNKNLEDKIIECHVQALRLFSLKSDPMNYCKVSSKLAIFYFENGYYDEVFEYAKMAFKAMNMVRDEVVNGTNDFEEKERLQNLVDDVASCVIQVYVRNGRVAEALEVTELFSTRCLVELEYCTTSKSKPITLPEMRSAIGESGAALIWHSSPRFTGVFVLTSESCKVFIYDSTDTLYTNSYTQKWGRSLQASNEDTKGSDEDEDTEVSYEDLHSLSGILQLSEVSNLIPPSVDSIVVIPHGIFHAFPLAAIPFPSVSLLDRYEGRVSFCPSFRLLLSVLTFAELDWSFPILAVDQTTSIGESGSTEVPALEHLTKNRNEMIVLRDAKVETVKDGLKEMSSRNCRFGLHLACHGFYDLYSRWDCCLIMNDGERLTARDLTSLDLRKCSLCVMASCVSGITDAFKSQEAVGLVSCLHTMGVTNIVSCLWEIEDVVIQILIIKMYETIFENPKLSINEALWESQNYVKNITSKELYQNHRDLFTEASNSPYKPFHDPCYWAGFVVSGPLVLQGSWMPHPN